MEFTELQERLNQADKRVLSYFASQFKEQGDKAFRESAKCKKEGRTDASQHYWQLGNISRALTKVFEQAIE